MAVALLGACLALIGAAFLRFSRRTDCQFSAHLPAVTILRPLHGAPPGIEEALASALTQRYSGAVQTVFGLQCPADPAGAVVERLRQRFPDADIELVIDRRFHGANRKISNLINILPAAKHEHLVVADADIIVPDRWLAAVTGVLARKGVGAASCFYLGEGTAPWSRLSAMGISYQFLPNAVFGTVVRLAYPFFGATMAMTKTALRQIGGLEAFRNSLADDYEIGRAVRARGYSIAYPFALVRHVCGEQDFREIWRHEYRWSRTIRTVNPLGHCCSLVSHALPLAVIALLFLGITPATVAVLGIVTGARVLLKIGIDKIAGVDTGPARLLPLRDFLSFGVFCASLLGHEVDWRGGRFRIGKQGVITPVSG